MTENLTGRFKKNQSPIADGKFSPAVSKKIRVRSLTENSHRQFQKNQSPIADGKFSPAVSKKSESDR